MRVRIQSEPFDPGAEIDRRRRSSTRIGAIASFVGGVRDLNEEADVQAMALEHYPGMTERSIEAIVDEAAERWSLIDVSVVHRVGRLEPRDPIVLVVTASAHRHDAFQACEFIMDYLKTRAPFWKKESTPRGERWVASRTSDEQAARRWREESTPRGSAG